MTNPERPGFLKKQYWSQAVVRSALFVGVNVEAAVLKIKRVRPTLTAIAKNCDLFATEAGSIDV